MNNTQYAEVDGVNLRYVKVGEGEPLVLIHTLRTQLDYFQRIVPTLAEHFEVYVLDLPGHGHSDIPSGEYTSDFLTGFVEGLFTEVYNYVGGKRDWLATSLPSEGQLADVPRGA